MDYESFLQELNLPVNAEIDPVERAFMERLKERLQQVAENYTETGLTEEDAWLRDFMTQFFGYSLGWLGKEAEKYKDVKEFDTAPKMKKEARAVIQELQQYMIEFVSCYMHVGRFMTLLRDEIKKEEIKVTSMPGQKIRWTADAGVLIGRYRKEKLQLVARTERMAHARKILEQIEKDFDIVRDALVNLFGKDKAELMMRKFVSALRVMDLTKARKFVKAVGEEKKRFGIDQKSAAQSMDALAASAQKIIKVIEAGEKIIMSAEEGRVFLKPVETDLAYNADIKELQKIKGFLGKYHLPYMQYKLDALQHLKDKLLVMNTLESLMTLYKRLLLGIAVPLKDIKTVRLYENDILNHVKYLLTGHREELPKILQRAEETVKEFRENREELESFDDLDLSEIEVTEPQAARA